MDRDDRHHEFELRERISGCGTVAEVAGIVVTSFEAIDRALKPVIGARGVVALFNRSVHLASVQRAWLRRDGEPSAVALDLDVLEKAFEHQGLEEAAGGGSELLQTFRALLSTIVGESLTERLLPPAWTRISNETAVPKGLP